MAKKRGGFGFGSEGKLGGKIGASHYRRSQNRQRIYFLLILLFLLAVLIPFAVIRGMALYDRFLEEVPPQVQVSRIPTGLGKETVSLKIVASDSGSGLGDIRVSCDQAGQHHDVFHKTYTEAKDFDTVIFDVSAVQARLSPGDATIVVQTIDRSIFKNKQTSTFPVKVDYAAPSVEPISVEHNANLGGAELVFYRVKDENSVFSGTKIGSQLFQGFPAKNLDPFFENFPNVYFAFFPVPFTWNREDQIQLFAQDVAGNIGTSSFRYSVRPYKGVAGKIQMSEQFLQSSVNTLFNAYKKIDSDFKGWPVREFSTAPTPEEWIERFAVVNVRYREWTEKQVRALLSNQPQAVKYWDGPFIRMVGAVTESGFGAKRTYMIGGREAGQSIHYGVDLASISQAPVVAGNDGIVLFAGDLGIYGNAIVIDHGFGLSSLYGHLSSIGVSTGQPVKKGEQIAKSGSSGLAGGDHLHFEIRLHGEPVHPREWWDQKWITDHIEGKIANVKAILTQENPEAAEAANAAAERNKAADAQAIKDNGAPDSVDKTQKLLDEARKLLEQ